MKLIKLSLAAALAAGAFSVASATPLDEAIKDVDVSGVLRYRYKNGDVTKKYRGYWRGFQSATGIGNAKQAHNFLGKLGFQAAIADDFKAYLEFYYNTGNEAGYGSDAVSKTDGTFSVRQYYLTYTAEPVDTSILFGKMQVESIWTTSFLGLVGTGAKILNTSLEGTVLAAYAFDTFDAKSVDSQGKCNGGVEGDTVLSNPRFGTNGVLKLGGFNPFTKNLYGVAGIGSYDLGFGQLNSQLWLAYLTDTFFLYAVDLGFKTSFANDLGWKLNLGYLGNAAQSDFKKGILQTTNAGENGNFVGLNGTIEYIGFDASLGGFYYGNKDKFTVTTLEDTGGIGHFLAGEEIFYTDGSNLTGDVGQNVFGFVKAGYTFNEVLRLGFDFVYGGTKMGNSKVVREMKGLSGAGDKLEAVARVDYKYSPKLNFQAWYSYVDIDTKKDHDNSKNSVRLQALYKF